MDEENEGIPFGPRYGTQLVILRSYIGIRVDFCSIDEHSCLVNRMLELEFIVALLYFDLLSSNLIPVKV